MKTLLVVFFVFVFAAAAVSQKKTDNFFRFTTEDGLSHGTVYSIYQDSENFLWFGTFNGLNRFDGLQFINFKPDTSYYGYKKNSVRVVFEDSKNRLWVGTENNGLYFFDKQTESLIEFAIAENNLKKISNNSIRAIFEDINKNLWVGTGNGLNKFLEKDNVFQTNFLFADSINNNLIINYICEYNSNIWVATNTGFYYSKYNTGKFSPPKFGKNCEFLKEATVRQIHFSHEGVLWLACKEGTFTCLLQENENNEFEISQLNTIISDNTWTLLNDKNDNHWLGTIGNGLQKIIVENNNRNYNIINFNNNLIGSNIIRSAYQANDGSLWFGTRSKGVCRLNPETSLFSIISCDPANPNSLINNIIYSIFEDADGLLWIGTYKGLCVYNKEKKSFKNYTHSENNQNSISDNFITKILSLNDKNVIWIATKNGLNKFNKTTGKFTRYSSKNQSAFLTDTINCAIGDLYGNLWLGTNEGIIKMAEAKNTEIFSIVDTRNEIISNYEVYALQTSTSEMHILWAATNNGLLRINIFNRHSFCYKHDPQKKESLPDNELTALCEDDNGSLWVGTRYHGVAKMISDLQGFETINKNKGLCDNSVFSLQNDKTGNLWIGTEQGLACYNLPTKTITNFYETGGLPANEFNRNAHFLSASGNLFFGTIDGLIQFNPKNIFSTETKPSFYISELKIADKKISPGEQFNGRVILVKSLIYTKEIELLHYENVLSFKFSMPDYNNPRKNNFYCKLVPFEKNWNNLNNQNSVTYTNLSPGKYTLYAKGTNTKGQSSNETYVNIIIVEPFWKKKWVIIAFCSVVFFAVFLWIRYKFIRQQKENYILQQKAKNLHIEIIKQQDELLMNKDYMNTQNKAILRYEGKIDEIVEHKISELLVVKNKAEKADKLKSTFLTQFSKKINSPLKSISLFNSLLTEPYNTREEIIEFTLQIKKCLNAISSLTDNISIVSKIEASEIKIIEREINLNEFIKQQITFAINFAKSEGKESLKIVESCASENVSIVSDAKLLKTIFESILKNAVKFTEVGSVEIGFKLKDKGVLCYVKDTGIGIDLKYHNDIFRLFSKINPNTNDQYQGMGLGLSITKYFVEFINGSIWVESATGNGSTFFVFLPMSINTASLNNVFYSGE